MNKYLVITDVDHFRRHEIEADRMTVNEEGAVNFYIDVGKEENPPWTLSASFSPDHLVAVIQVDN